MKVKLLNFFFLIYIRNVYGTTVSETHIDFPNEGNTNILTNLSNVS